VIIALVGGVVFLIFSQAGEDETSTTEISTSLTSTSVDETPEGSDDTTSCPEGLICLGSGEIASAPTITVGQDADYLQAAIDTGGDDDEDNDGDQGTGEITPTSPLDVTITNKDYKVWSVTWVTSAAQTGYLSYGTSASELTKQAIDNRDTSLAGAKKRFTHHVTVTNTDSELEDDNLTFYFKIMSGGEEYDNNGAPYQYSNAPLTASPSSPNSIAVRTTVLSQYEADDYIVIARLSDGSSVSSPVSGAFGNSKGIELVVGTARNESLSSYFAIGSSTTVAVRIYGPDGYTGYLGSVSYSSLEGEVLDITMYQTGYAGEGTFTSKFGDSSYTIGSKANVGPNVPSTGIEDAVLFKAVWGGVILVLGVVTLILFVPWNHKRMWEHRLMKQIDRTDAID